MKAVKQGFVVCMDTLFQGDVIACKTESDTDEDVMLPTFFETYSDAWKEIADDMVIELQQFIDGERNLEDTSFGTEDYVGYAVLYDDDIIIVYSADDTGIDFTNEIIKTTVKEINE